MKVQLYRKDGAQGGATHWATVGPVIDGYDLLGIGEYSRIPEPRIHSAGVFCCAGLVDNRLFRQIPNKS